MKQYEYKLFKNTTSGSKCSTPYYLVDLLNELGSKGWKPIKIHHDTKQVGHIYTEIICVREIKQEKLYKCDLCGKKFNKYELFITSMDSDAKLVCDKCVENIKERKKVICDCGEEYESPYSLHVCEICSKTICEACGDLGKYKCVKCLKSHCKPGTAKDAEGDSDV